MTTSEGTGLVELPFSPSGMPGKESGVVWLMPLSVADLFVSLFPGTLSLATSHYSFGASGFIKWLLVSCWLIRMDSHV